MAARMTRMERRFMRRFIIRRLIITTWWSFVDIVFFIPWFTHLIITRVDWFIRNREMFDRFFAAWKKTWVNTHGIFLWIDSVENDLSNALALDVGIKDRGMKRGRMLIYVFKERRFVIIPKHHVSRRRFRW